MRIIFVKRKAQSTAEYAILIGLVVAAVIGMQTYVKRGLQERTHDATQDFYGGFTGDTNWANISKISDETAKDGIETGQYEDSRMSSKSTQNVTTNEQSSDMAVGGTVTRSSANTSTQAQGDFQKADY
jgi:hypothetical protein